jgi:folate-binding Fe-S cluster repair protein YgfZ
VGQENTARIKLKNKLSKKLLPIKVLDGVIKIDDQVSINKKDLGKILISEKYPFGLIKFKDENFDFDKKLNCGSALIKVLKPEWLK